MLAQEYQPESLYPHFHYSRRFQNFLFISISAKRHKKLEKVFKAKDRHLLNLDKYILENEIDNTKDNGENNTIIEDIEKLNELYKSGVITKEEFEKAKKQLLN